MQKILTQIGTIFLVIFLSLLVAYLIIGELLLEPEVPLQRSQTLDYNEGWTLSWNGEEQDVHLPLKLDASFNDSFTISKTITSQAEGCEAVLLWNKGQDVQAAINGVQVYTYDEKDVSSWGFDRPYLWLMISTPQLHEGDTLTLTFQSVNVNSLGEIGDVRVGTDFALEDNIFHIFRVELIAAVFLALFGLFCVIGSVISRVFAKRLNAIGYLGAAVFLISLWMIADSRMRQFVFPNASVIRQVAFLCVTLIPAPFALYLDEIQQKRYHYAYVTIEMLSYSASIICFVADYLRIQGLSATFIYSATLCFLMIAIMVATFVMDGIHGDIKSYRLVAIGFVAMGVSGAIEVLYYIFSQSKALSSTIILVGLSILAICSLIYALQGFETLHQEKSAALDKVKNISIEMMETLVKTVDAKDHYTSGHSLRVANYAKGLAERMGFTPKETDAIYYAGMLHDLGKIGVSDEIINKPDRLTAEEYAIIKSHPVVGYEILSTISEHPDIMNAARWHHERYDGAGYPDGLAGENIPLFARIISVADAYDAMTSVRSYRPALSRRAVLKELEKGRGTQFDPHIVDVMVQMVNEVTLAQEEERQENARLQLEEPHD